ncbi:MAG: tetraacyldisaccharide 4'-kinase [Deltaproteobacteria bacterium]|nr:tetraacyldisaccharide 4'-kinase [Deltaproteobacteria bacterium]
MAAEETIQRLWKEEQPGGRDRILRSILHLLSLPYGIAMAARNRLYDGGILRQERLPCRVISVGNLTVGGTGKTPMVIFLANLLKTRGRRPAVLSRGYGGSAQGPVNVVSDGNRICMNWREAGDEPALIARAIEGVPVLTGPARALTGRTALERFGADCLILDDGFQHRALHRDLDIVLIDAARPFGNGYILPRGPLRESPQELRRAHLIVRTGSAEGSVDASLLPDLPLPSFRGTHQPVALVEADTGRVRPLADLQGRKVCAFAGIGRPESFRKSLTELGADIKAFRAYPDHHPYASADLDLLRQLAGETGADRIVTTEKDGVRLADFPDFLPHVLLLRIGMEIAPAEPFRELIFSRLAY